MYTIYSFYKCWQCSHSALCIAQIWLVNRVFQLLIKWFPFHLRSDQMFSLLSHTDEFTLTKRNSQKKKMKEKRKPETRVGYFKIHIHHGIVKALLSKSKCIKTEWFSHVFHLTTKTIWMANEMHQNDLCVYDEWCSWMNLLVCKIIMTTADFWVDKQYEMQICLIIREISREFPVDFFLCPHTYTHKQRK